jgi:histidinol-phosphate/aromatic aminotransferase/cobyric acid decarboxylase-like protein
MRINLASDGAAGQNAFALRKPNESVYGDSEARRSDLADPIDRIHCYPSQHHSSYQFTLLAYEKARRENESVC